MILSELCFSSESQAVDNSKAAGMRDWAWEQLLDMPETFTIGIDFSHKHPRQASEVPYKTMDYVGRDVLSVSAVRQVISLVEQYIVIAE